MIGMEALRRFGEWADRFKLRRLWRGLWKEKEESTDEERKEEARKKRWKAVKAEEVDPNT
jgi:hypothetical protein